MKTKVGEIITKWHMEEKITTPVTKKEKQKEAYNHKFLKINPTNETDCRGQHNKGKTKKKKKRKTSREQ